jgi:hypothetical protein
LSRLYRLLPEELSARDFQSEEKFYFSSVDPLEQLCYWAGQLVVKSFQHAAHLFTWPLIIF